MTNTSPTVLTIVQTEYLAGGVVEETTLGSYELGSNEYSPPKTRASVEAMARRVATGYRGRGYALYSIRENVAGAQG